MRGWIGKLGWGLGGLALGVGITVVSSSFAGDPQPPEDSQVLVALGQLMDTEHRRVDLLLDKGDGAGAIAASRSAASAALAFARARRSAT